MSNVTALPLESFGPPDAGFLLDTYLRHDRDRKELLRNKRREEHGHTTESWYASSLGSCFRQQYLQRKGAPRLRAIDEQARRTFAWGDHVEEFLRKTYQRCGLVEDTQVRLEHGSLVARGDMLLRYPPQKVSDIPEDVLSGWSPEWVDFLHKLRADIESHPFKGLVHDEIKSAKSTAMRYMYNAKNPSKSQGARREHLIQVGATMLLETLVPDAPRPDFHQVEYIGKDAVGVLRFKVGSEWAEVAKERWQTLDAAWDADVDPLEVPCDCASRFGGKGRTFCAYFDGSTCCGEAGLMATAGDPV